MTYETQCNVCDKKTKVKRYNIPVRFGGNIELDHEFILCKPCYSEEKHKKVRLWLGMGRKHETQKKL